MRVRGGGKKWCTRLRVALERGGGRFQPPSSSRKTDPSLRNAPAFLLIDPRIRGNPRERMQARRRQSTRVNPFQGKRLDQLQSRMGISVDGGFLHDNKTPPPPSPSLS